MARKRSKVILLNPFTCGIYKDGGARYKVDPETGKRTSEIDNQLGDHVEQLLQGQSPPGLARVSLNQILRRRILVPRYYDYRWTEGLQSLLEREGLEPITLGQLEEQGIIEVGGGHGSPSNDVRNGTIPYIKVSDIRALRINVNPTNLVPEPIAERFWGGRESGLRAWDLITPNRASSNIGEFAVLLPGEERVVLTKEVFVIRVVREGASSWDPFYLLWAFCLKAVRLQWQRVTLMQTNREDVGARYQEIEIPRPKSRRWAREVSKPFRESFTTLAGARRQFVETLAASGYEYVAAAYTTGAFVAEAETPEDVTALNNAEEDLVDD